MIYAESIIHILIFVYEVDGLRMNVGLFVQNEERVRQASQPARVEIIVRAQRLI
jgi:hypothetical protein